MDRILQSIEDSIRDFLIGVIQTNMESMFGYVNEKAGEVISIAGQTPQGFNAGIFNMVRSLSTTVIIPIAGLILTYVLCYELIAMVVEKNHGNEISTFEFFKYFFKMCIAVMLVSHTFEITMAVFDVGHFIVEKSAGVISHETAIDASAAISAISEKMRELELSDLFMLTLETLIMSFFTKIITVLISTIMYGRMIEIYLYCSVSPIPFSTMVNREWGNIGSNYIKSILALAFQGFFMAVCIGIYSVLISTMSVSSDIHMSLFSILTYTIVLAISLYHTGSVSKSIFNAH